MTFHQQIFAAVLSGMAAKGVNVATKQAIQDAYDAATAIEQAYNAIAPQR